MLGGGTMGAGIAEVFLKANARVHVVEASSGAAAQTLGRLQSPRNPPAGWTEVLSGLQVGASLPVDEHFDLVIEALPEDINLKSTLLGQIGETWPEVLIATNTSSLSITELARRVPRPNRFLGMHFFNPVPRSKLVEIVVGEETSAAAADMATSWVGRLNLDFITVKDSPGFATSRLGVLLGLEAMRMLEDDVASAKDIDKGIRLGYAHPMGPLELTDLVGLDVRLAIAQYLHSTLGDRYKPPAILERLVAEGSWGKKTGKGFYDWTNPA